MELKDIVVSVKISEPSEDTASCVKAGIVFGRSKDLIAAKGNIIRAEAATIVQRLLRNSGLI